MGIRVEMEGGVEGGNEAVGGGGAKMRGKVVELKVGMKVGIEDEDEGGGVEGGDEGRDRR